MFIKPGQWNLGGMKNENVVALRHQSNYKRRGNAGGVPFGGGHEPSELLREALLAHDLKSVHPRGALLQPFQLHLGERLPRLLFNI